jgi:hypothetical protein
MGTDGGVDESVVQPAADEGEVQQRVGPLISGRFFFGGTKRRRGVGWWWRFTPLFATESESKREKPTFTPRLRFVPRFLLAFPITAALGTIRITLP